MERHKPGGGDRGGTAGQLQRGVAQAGARPVQGGDQQLGRVLGHGHRPSHNLSARESRCKNEEQIKLVDIPVDICQPSKN